MKKIILIVTIVFISLFFALPHVIAEGDMHCPDHTLNFKYDVSGSGGSGTHNGISFTISGPTVEFNDMVDFCVKADVKNSGIITRDSFTVDWLNPGGQIADISYIVIYTPEPTPTVVEPTPTVVEPTPTVVGPTPTQTTLEPTQTKEVIEEKSELQSSPTQMPLMMPQTGATGNPKIIQLGLIVAIIVVLLVSICFAYIYIRK